MNIYRKRRSNVKGEENGKKKEDTGELQGMEGKTGERIKKIGEEGNGRGERKEGCGKNE